MEEDTFYFCFILPPSVFKRVSIAVDSLKGASVAVTRNSFEIGENTSKKTTYLIPY